MDTLPIPEARMQGEIEALRSQYPETQDLYREVCVVLFFRYGLTPTANKLYQLVRKGSMSAPAEALARFWETLREKSRTRIEHPDLPEPLRDAAGEMVGALWQRALAEARASLVELREEARAAVVAAEGTALAADARAEAADEALNAVRAELHATQEKLTGTQAELARAQGQVTALQREVDAGVEQRRETQEALHATQERFTRELEQQRAAATRAEERHSTETKRVLLDLDRERGNVAKIQKELDQARRALTDQAELHRQQALGRQQQLEGLHQRNGELEGRVTELQEQRDQLARDAEALRARLEQGASTAGASESRPVKRKTAGVAKTTRKQRTP